jgi:alpha-L-rhamnosidase
VHEQGDHLDTGALATKIILPVLTQYGFADEAWRVATQTTFPSGGFWRENGATSLWEHWKLASRSRGHYFLGTVDDWLYGDVAGLAPAGAGWRVIRFRPSMTASLDHASASTFTPYGTAAIAWNKASHGVDVNIDVPVGATGEVTLPGKGPVTEQGRAVASKACGASRCLTVGSGRYRFSVAP